MALSGISSIFKSGFWRYTWVLMASLRNSTIWHNATPARRRTPSSVSGNCDLAATVVYERTLRCFPLTYFLVNALARRVSLRRQTPRRHHDRNFQTHSYAMNSTFLRGLTAAILLQTALFSPGALSPEQLAQLPAPAGHPVDFTKEIKPILEVRCVKCHGRGKSKGDFSLETREALLKGGTSGAAILPGKSRESYLIELVSGLDPDSVMPKKGSRLTPAEVGLLRAWIDQGAPWDTKITFAKPEPLNLKPRLPEVPRFAGVSNPVDAFMRAYTQKLKTAPPPAPVGDRVFIRRAYLDLVGLVPTPAQTAEFVASRDPRKRQTLARSLLDDRENYAIHWLSFWNDALRNDYRGTGYIDGGRKQITSWLCSALGNNLPYDQFVAQLVSPRPESEGFSKGIVWRGVVNASQLPPMQAAQNISQVFMGVNLKCASCHDSFINDWALSEAYGMANLYSDEPLEIFRCDQPTGQKAGYQFLYPQLGRINTSTNKAERLERLAEVITSREDGRLPRTIINRLWARLFGRGLVEPLDDMDNPAWNQDLLDWLAEDLVSHHYDLKQTLYRLATSEAYQWPSVNLPERVSTNFVFKGPAVRRMSAEQFRDAVGELTGAFYEAPAGDFDFSWLNPGDSTNAIQQRARWIWDRPEAARTAPPGTVYFRREITLESQPAEAFAYVACDNRYTLFVNGHKAGEGSDYANPRRHSLRALLKPGVNLIAVKAVNDDPGGDKDKPHDNPAGLVFYARIRPAGSEPSKPRGGVVELVSDSSWTWSAKEIPGWEKPGTVVSGWKNASEAGGVEAGPWNIAANWARAISSARFLGRSRAALANADALQVALGRPNREQVMTARASVATTLQALELSNGKELDKLMVRGAEHWLGSKPFSSLDLVSDIYQQALGRAPTVLEERAALGLVGQPAGKEGLEDFLWAVCMHPEFQLIY